MLRRLSLRQLTVFLEAVRTMNFARAAETPAPDPAGDLDADSPA
jgi:hypothetical protein